MNNMKEKRCPICGKHACSMTESGKFATPESVRVVFDTRMQEYAPMRD